VTVFADMGVDTGALPGSAALPQPGPGEVWIGGGITDTDVKGPLQLSGYRSLQFKIAGEFDRDTDMATHGLVLLSPGDARRLLDIPPGHVSDLAIDVFHAAEAEAILPELETAFPWPVQITTRQSAVKFYTAFFARKSGVWALVLVPTILALVLLTAALFEGQVRFSSEMGLLKALGWTSADIARYHFYRTGAIGLTAAAAGGALAYGLVFYPGVTWPHHLLLFNSPYVPGLYLNASGVAGVILEIAALVVAPFLVAAYWASLKGVGADPADLLEAGQSS
jgi:ABC-type lipoprotein release transport system permease subunit